MVFNFAEMVLFGEELMHIPGINHQSLFLKQNLYMKNPLQYRKALIMLFH